MHFTHFPIIELDSIDSTNNYAMQLIDANKAQRGMTIVAKSQVAGKGQRGKAWVDVPGESLLMSIITIPPNEISSQFAFNASVAVAIAQVVQKIVSTNTYIKWPNDIIVNDKKAGGILIENVIRGNRWTHSVIGLGINVKQESFPLSLPFATSLKIASGTDIDIKKLCSDLQENIMQTTLMPLQAEQIMAQYNELLYKRDLKQSFWDAHNKWEATILGAHRDGSLEVQLNDGSKVFYQHGQAIWDWGM